MADHGDQFERGLERELQEWTDLTARRQDWTAEARALIAAGARPGAPRWRVIALSAATTVLAAAAGLFVLNLVPFNGGPVASASAQPSGTTASAAATTTPEPSTLPGNQLGLSRLAWWDELGRGFGCADPLPCPTTLPAAYRQVRIGTLDGRITAVLKLSDAWSHSYVSGPVGTDVLVVNDDGTTSTISLVSALDGSKTVLTSDQDIIPAAALSPTGDEVYYVKVDRQTGIDLGLWRRPSIAAATDRPILRSPLGEPLQELSVWQVLTSRDGKTIIVQSCFGEVRCASYFVTLATGAVRQINSIGWPRGTTDTELLARGLGPGGLVGVNLATLELRTLLPVPLAMPVRVGGRWLLAFASGDGLGPTLLLGLDGMVQGPVPGDGKDPPGSSINSLGWDRFGIHLPDGWVIRGPGPGEAGVSQLINVVTGERVTLNPFTEGVGHP